MKLGRKPEKQQTADKQIFVVTSDSAVRFGPAFARDTLLAIAPPVPAALMPHIEPIRDSTSARPSRIGDRRCAVRE